MVCIPKTGIVEEVVLVIVRFGAVEMETEFPPKMDGPQVVGCPLNIVGVLNVGVLNGCTWVLFPPNIDFVLSFVLSVAGVDTIAEISKVFSGVVVF